MYSDSTPKCPTDHRCASLCSLLASILYCFTLAPTVTGEDGGEFIAAAYSLGIPHPTGYPLWTMLAHCFGLILPFGEYAWRINFMSAFWAAATIYLLVLTLRHLNVSRVATVTASLAFATSREFWEQSVIAEVYTLNAFFLILCLYLLLCWTKSKSPTTLYAFTLLYSLSLSNHSTMALLGPVFLVYIFYQSPPLLREYKTLGICIGLILAGLLVQLYLPIRSRANPAMDWGNPETFQAYWDVFTRKQYQAMMTKDHTLPLFFLQLWSFLKYYLWEFTPWVLLLALPGIKQLHNHSKSTGFLMASIFSIVLLASILVPNFPIEHYWIWLNTTYWIPCYLITAIWLGFSLDYAIKRLKMPSRLLYALALVTILSPLLIHFKHNDQSNYYFTHDYARNILTTMDEDAIYFGSGDHTIFPVTYLQIVENVRNDVTLANGYGYISPELYREMPEDLRATMPAKPRNNHDPIIFNWLLEYTDRPVYTTQPWPSKTHQAIQHGLLYTYHPKDSTPPPAQNNFWDTYTWHTLNPDDTHGDWTAEVILYEYRIARARYLLNQDRFDEAMPLINEAAQLVHGNKESLYNLGLVLARENHLEEAKALFIQALQEDKQYVAALYNLALCYHKQGLSELALKYCNRLIDQEPDNPRFHQLHKKILQSQKTSQDK